MPFTAEFQRARAIELGEWVTPGGIVLVVGGELDAMGCRAVEQHLRRLVARWPGLLLTLDLDGVTRVDDAAAEGLLLGVVALRAGEARLAIAAKAGAFRTVLTRMGVALQPPSGTLLRWPGDGFGTGHLLSGVTA